MIRIPTLHEQTDEQWAEEKARFAKEVMTRDEQVAKDKAAADRQTLIDSRVKALKEAGWEEMEGRMILMLPEGVAHPEANGLADKTQMDFDAMVSLGNAELTRRRKVEEDRIAQEAVRKEQERVQAEAARAKEAEIERLSKLGDAGLLEEMSKHIIVASAAIAEGLNKCKSATAKLGIRKAIGHLGDAGTVITGTIKDLK